MKYTLLLIVILSAMTSFKAPAKKTKVVLFGDSITQMGVRPNGYVVKMDSLIKLSTTDSIQLVGAGIGGNKVYDLYLRMETDVLDQNPDVVVIYIGINDVWHKSTSGTGTDPDKFEKFYKAIIKKLHDRNIKVLICTPTVIGEKNDYTNEQDGDLNKYAGIIKKIGADTKVPVCDLRSAFVDYLKANNSANAERGVLTTDRVHLNDAGNLFLAQQMWKELAKLVK
jgi:isoamyl acetate esterase